MRSRQVMQKEGGPSVDVSFLFAIHLQSVSESVDPTRSAGLISGSSKEGLEAAKDAHAAHSRLPDDGWLDEARLWRSPGLGEYCPGGLSSCDGEYLRPVSAQTRSGIGRSSSSSSESVDEVDR